VDGVSAHGSYTLFSPPKQPLFAVKWKQQGDTATTAKASKPFESNHPINRRTCLPGKFPVTRLQGTQRPEMRQEKRRVKGAKGGNYL
jgi:hypothetical protein